MTYILIFDLTVNVKSVEISSMRGFLTAEIFDFIRYSTNNLIQRKDCNIRCEISVGRKYLIQTTIIRLQLL